jgi:hypothetical protein
MELKESEGTADISIDQSRVSLEYSKNQQEQLLQQILKNTLEIIEDLEMLKDENYSKES